MLLTLRASKLPLPWDELAWRQLIDYEFYKTFNEQVHITQFLNGSSIWGAFGDTHWGGASGDTHERRRVLVWFGPNVSRAGKRKNHTEPQRTRRFSQVSALRSLRLCVRLLDCRKR